MARNNRKLLFLVLLFPIILSAFVFIILKISFGIINAGAEAEYYEKMPEVSEVFMTAMPVIILACVLFTLFSFFQGKSLVLHLAGAEACPQTPEYAQVFHAVENVALAAGIPSPKVYIMKTKSLNAFATGYSPKNAAITITTGLIEHLKPLELEAVIAHEIGHILNRDIRLNLFVITGIGVIGLIGEMLLRTRFHSRQNSKSKGDSAHALLIMWAIGIGLYLFRYSVAPFIHMAISRTQEFQADATSAYLTRNPQALADALGKIAGNPYLDKLEDTKEMAAMCIYNPLMDTTHLLDTHPSVKDRIERLESMS